VTTDRYRRTVAEMWAGGVDLSCWQMRAGAARYIVKYDTGRRIARACGR
jgi:micrococcal nuclease